LVYAYNFPGEVASFGDVRVDFARMELVRNGGEVQLTATEFKLLAFLLQNPERVISRKELLDTIWGYPTDPATRTVDIHISKLRQKVERDPANPIHLRTVHCSGYKFVP
jgi:two-component system alkaline phosphatase synthesis response regulator PhoP